MKEKIQKLANLNKEVVDLIKGENMDQAVEKLAEIQELTKEMEESAVETPADPQTQDPANAGDGEAIEKAEKIAKAMETLEKYAQLNITAESIKDLIDQFGELKNQMTNGLDTINKRLEVVESAKGISKQAGEEINKGQADNVWADLPL